VPTAGAQATKHRGFGGFVVQMKRLRVKLTGKGDDVFDGGADAALVAHLTHGEIFPIKLRLNHQRPPETSIKLMVV
jgi:hypothetical protein